MNALFPETRRGRCRRGKPHRWGAMKRYGLVWRMECSGCGFARERLAAPPEGPWGAPFPPERYAGQRWVS